ncbi:MAG TPA: glycoside hydrolase family 66 protein [Firmicutes bacterium]|nr:glycoside hydrolase family 66 protein [Bacillota bacterium]
MLSSVSKIVLTSVLLAAVLSAGYPAPPVPVQTAFAAENTQTDAIAFVPSGQNSSIQESRLRLLEEELPERPETPYILDVCTNRSVYQPGERAQISIHLQNPFNGSLAGTLKVRLVFCGEILREVSRNISSAKISFSICLPEEDFNGYGLETYFILPDGTLADYYMNAIDCSSDSSRFPRMAYIAGDMDVRTAAQSQAILKPLADQHINLLYFQDFMDRHEYPLAGTPDKPAAEYQTLAKNPVSAQTLQDMLSAAKGYGMSCFMYNLMYGAYTGYTASGISPEWGLYRDPNHQEQDFHALPAGWETDRLWLFNPADPSWQAHYIQAFQDFLQVYPFDGILVDTLGNRGTRYDYFGNPVALDQTYAVFLQNLQDGLAQAGFSVPLLVNPVGGYGLTQTSGLEGVPFLFMECWPSDHPDYNALKERLDGMLQQTGGERGVVLAAYMNYQHAKNGGAFFNEPGVRMTDAVILANGGFHMELGDNGMLSSEYYPGTHLRMTDSLREATESLNHFGVAYQNLLRGTDLRESSFPVQIAGRTIAETAQADTIWAFSKQNTAENLYILHLINLVGQEDIQWADTNADRPAPPLLENLPVRVYLPDVSAVWVASPDTQEGIPRPLLFRTGTDSKGEYVEFELPSLEYWDMLVFSQK